MPLVEIRKTREILFDINDNADFSSHLHKNLELAYLLKGKFTISIHGKAYEMEEGDICISFPFCIHEGKRNGQNTMFIMIYDTDSLPFADLFKSGMPEYAKINDRDLPSGFRDNILTLTYGYSAPDTMLGIRIRDSFISLILAQCLEKLNIVPGHCGKSDDNLMIKTLVYCADNYTNPAISLESAASAMFLSKYYLSHLFSSKMNIGFKKYITRMRVEKAARLLTSTDIKVSEISAVCGFVNVRTFNREFLAVIGATPREYRKTEPKSNDGNESLLYAL